MFSTDFQNKSKYQNFMKIRPVGDELFHADGQMDVQTDMKQPAVAFCSFAEAPKILFLQVHLRGLCRVRPMCSMRNSFLFLSI